MDEFYPGVEYSRVGGDLLLWRTAAHERWRRSGFSLTAPAIWLSFSHCSVELLLVSLSLLRRSDSLSLSLLTVWFLSHCFGVRWRRSGVEKGEPDKHTHPVPTLPGQGDRSMPPPHSVVAAVRPPPPSPLYKHKSWSPDILRDEEWLKRKDIHDHRRRRRRNKSVTDEDIDELKACIELGFGFDESNDRLSSTLPALGLYYTVNKQYHDTISKSSSMSSSSSVSSYSSSISESDLFSPSESPHAAVFSRGDDPQTMKTRLRQWAQVVACSLRQSSLSSSSSSSSSSS
ncbi:hypothetical protein L6452_44341 [Arctium lappa]|uniref:Uncharacterized protein n=1 Tax=Arctium lappa TaxID=4217 RepID=A0ACB8XGK0_ARCLA|nr:hypothetical protein L6452_44341 [Arctium lappa]